MAATARFERRAMGPADFPAIIGATAELMMEGGEVAQRGNVATRQPPAPTQVRLVQVPDDPFQELATLVQAPAVINTEVERRLGVAVAKHAPTLLRILRPRSGAGKTPTEGVAFETLFETQEFLLEAVRFQAQDTVGIVKTLTINHLYFSGLQPITVVITGSLLNFADVTLEPAAGGRGDVRQNWSARFLSAYLGQFTGTRLAQLGARAYLSVQDLVFEGYPTSLAVELVAVDPNRLRFTMPLLVTNLDVELTKFTQLVPEALEARADPGSGIQFPASAFPQNTETDPTNRAIVEQLLGAGAAGWVPVDLSAPAVRAGLWAAVPAGGGLP